MELRPQYLKHTNLRFVIRLSFILPITAAVAISQMTTTTSLGASPNPSAFGQRVTLSAAITPNLTAGNLTFYDGTTIVGTAPVVSGTASLSVILPASGIQHLSARFGGGGGYSASVSPAVTQTVNAVAASTVASPVGYATPSAINQNAAVADFNGDGHLDIVTNNFAILLGNGNGTFRRFATYSSGSDSYAVVTADFNGDGKPDFASARYDGNVGVWFGNGDGSFQSPVLIPVGAAPRNIAVADFNNDGIPDIAVASRQGQSTGIGILLGAGNGTFKPVVTYLTNQRETDLAIADFNGDGTADIVTADSDDILTPVNILLGNGDGTFRNAGIVSPVFPDFVAVGDFNLDGKPDFVTGTISLNQLSVFLGNGDGTFTAVSAQPLTPSPLGVQGAVVVADFDGDGIPDLGWTAGASGISVFLGNGDGTFRGAVPFAAGAQSEFLVAAEFNGDGRTDIAATNGSSIQILLSGAGSFPEVTTTTLPNLMLGVPYSATLSATGGATPYTWSESAGSPLITLSASGTLSGTAPANTQLHSNFDSFTVVVEGPNGSGFLSSRNFSVKVIPAFEINTQLVFVGKVGTRYSLSFPVLGGTAPYSNWTVTSGALPPGLTINAATGLIGGTPTQVGNFTFTLTVNDSMGLTSLPATLTIEVYPALSFVTQSLPNGFVGLPYYAVLHGTGGFPPYSGWTVSSGALPPGLTLDPNLGVISGTPTTTSGSPFTFSITFTDHNSVATPQSFTVAISNPGSASPTFATSANPSALGSALTLTATVQGGSGNVTFYDGSAVLGTSPIKSGQAVFTTTLLAPGTHALRALYYSLPAATVTQVITPTPDTSFLAAVNYPGAAISNLNLPMVVGDFNGDGKPDIARFSGNTEVSIYLGDGNGTFAAPVTDAGGPNAVAIATADFNEDGITDIAISSNDGIAVALGNGDGTFGTGATYDTGNFGGVMATADFNLDGHADLIAADDSNQLKLYLGVGDGTFRPVITAATGFTANGVQALAAADFNGDGIPDLALIQPVVVSPPTTSTTLNILLGHGDGTFAAPQSYALTSSSNFPLGVFAIGDLNGDGKTDLVVSGLALNTFTVLLGHGDGTFGAPTDYVVNVDGYLISVALTDYNADGIPDLIVSTPDSVVEVLLGNGDGSFRTGPGFSAADNAKGFTLAVGDFNLDGRPDAALGLNSGGINILLGSSALNQLTLSPAAMNVGIEITTPTSTQTVTVTLQTSSSTAPAFSVSQSGLQSYVSNISPSSGTMTLSSSSGSLYTWTAQIQVAFNLVGILGSVAGSLNFTAGSAASSLPVTLVAGIGPIPVGIVNASDAGQPSVVPLGSYIAIYGTQLAGAGAPSALALPLPATLNGAQATLGGISMPLLYAASGQVNAIVPQELAPGKSYPLVVTSGTTQSAPVTLLVNELQPGIYTVDASGSGPGIVSDAFTGQLITASNPAHASQYLTIYGNGLGPVHGPNGEAPPADGAAAPTTITYFTQATLTAIIGGVPATVTFSGLTPTLAALYQVNVQVPASVTPGTAIPVVLTATDSTTGATARSNSVTIAVQ